MRKQRSFFSVFMIVLLSCSLVSLVPVSGQTPPSLRLLSVEGMRNTEIEFGGVMVSCLEIRFTFALSHVEAWGDVCRYRFWEGRFDTVLVGNWSIGFSAGTPPQLQGLYGGDGFLGYTVVTAEFPYGYTYVDGVRHYLYRIYVYVDTTVVLRETLYFGGAYMAYPTLEGSSLLRLRAQKISDDGTIKVKSKRLHDE